jgi:hypothetical protein
VNCRTQNIDDVYSKYDCVDGLEGFSQGEDQEMKGRYDN